MIARVTITQNSFNVNSDSESQPSVEAEVVFRNWYKGEKGDKGDSPDMSDYYTKEEINTMIGGIESQLIEING